jgi:hypothetical protein
MNVMNDAHLRRGIILAMLAPALALSACAMSSTGTGPNPTLACTQNEAPQGVDVIAVTLSCKVSGAPSTDTSFQLHFTVSNDQGAKRQFDQLCQGTLQNGSGSCTATYSVIAPFSISTSSAQGLLLPSQRQIGPVTPGKAP